VPDIIFGIQGFKHHRLMPSEYEYSSSINKDLSDWPKNTKMASRFHLKTEQSPKLCILNRDGTVF
jgi:hypothetical protein